MTFHPPPFARTASRGAGTIPIDALAWQSGREVHLGLHYRECRRRPVVETPLPARNPVLGARAAMFVPVKGSDGHHVALGQGLERPHGCVAPFGFFSSVPRTISVTFRSDRQSHSFGRGRIQHPASPSARAPRTDGAICRRRARNFPSSRRPPDWWFGVPVRAQHDASAEHITLRARRCPTHPQQLRTVLIAENQLGLRPTHDWFRGHTPANRPQPGGIPASLRFWMTEPNPGH